MGDYKIVVQTTNSKKQAQSKLHQLQNNDIKSSIVTVNMGQQTLYSVQAGPYSYKKDALVNVDKIKQLGERNAFITNAAIS